MADKLIVNAHQHKCNNTVQEYRRDCGGDIIPSFEEITVMKTEVKEESYDFEMPANDIVFVSINEQYISSPENNFKKEDVRDLGSNEQSLHENVVSTNCESSCRCEFCHTGFDEEIYLKNHYKQCPLIQLKLSKKDLLLKCNSAEWNISVKELLVKQLEEPKKYKCDDCKYATKNKGHLDIHIRTHTNDRPFKCTYKNCKCTPGQKETCKCDTCGYAAAQKHHLNNHILVKHSEEPKKYKCRKCNYAAHKKHQLDRHIHTHANDRPFKCTYKNCKCTAEQEESCKCNMCGYAAAEAHNLKLHILMKHSAEPRKYKCIDCKYTAHKKQTLEQHIRTHTNDRPFKCTYKDCNCTPEQRECCKCSLCEYSAISRHHLNRHILSRHSTEPKRYQCRDCKFSSHLKCVLVSHFRTHTNERPFKCTYKKCICKPGRNESCKCNMCDYAAARKYALKEHIKIKHSATPKNYKCGNCGYVTHTKRNLIRHARIHVNR